MAFQGYLREDTAVVIPLGSYVDKGDGVTYEVGLAAAMNHADTGVRISKNGGALAARTTATEPNYDAFGYYLVDLDATDTGTPGRLKVIYGVPATALPCEADFVIIPATLWDTLFVVQPCAAINKFFDKASPTGTVNSLADAVPGAAGGGFIAGTNAATTITTALTAAIIGNITGNLSGSIGSYTGNTPQTADNDTLLTVIAGYLDTEIAAIVAAVITNAAGVDVAADIIALKAETVAIKAKTDLLPSGIPKNTALPAFEWLMVLSSDHVSPATGKTVVCQRSIDGAAFANCNTVNATEVSDGIYKVDLAASDLNGDVITLKFTEATCDTTLITIKTDT